ncbi:MAG TPA: hypothetical protein VJ692_09150 [Nitrospiraceae bacterium]|nr:hypothetical protein [Nitrospiraceae bacterium]
MSNSHKHLLQRSIRRWRCAGHVSPERLPIRGAVGRDEKTPRHEIERGKIACQIFIEQRKGGTEWASRKILIADGSGNQVIIGNQNEPLYSGNRFATAGSAAEAARQKAWSIIHTKYPGIHRGDISWHLVSEDVRGFVTV